MIAHAQAELPNECCGLLAGESTPEEGPTPANPIRQALQYYPLKNAAASPVEYLSDARSMFDAVREMRRLGLEIIAVYHSHPSSAPVPSRTDLERNYSDDVMNLIIGLNAAQPPMRAWWLTRESYQEGEWQLE
jgi:proteasome lid subunit RPN8/RPN11